MEKGSRAIFNTKLDLFPNVGRNEIYRSACFDLLQDKLSSENDYREVVEIINYLRHQDDNDVVKLRTLADAVVRDGAAIIDYIDTKTRQILKENHFDVDTGSPDTNFPIEENMKHPEIQSIFPDEVDTAIREYNTGKENDRQIDEKQAHESFEEASESVNISVDDIGVTEQKPGGRSKGSRRKESRHYVNNTVIHVQYGQGRYILDGLGIRNMLIALVAFLLHNGLFSNKMIVFFTDGADDIKNPIKTIFAWRPFKIILDWFHLMKKCKERLSMGMKGRKVRNEALKELLPLLWLGKIDAAIEYLRRVDPGKIKNVQEIEKLIAYIDRNRSLIPCYALRRKLGLRISSNMGEKANDLVVAQRQKHNGMSWSKAGSSALANVKTLFLNNEEENWIIRRKLNFKLIPSSAVKSTSRTSSYSRPKAVPEKKCA